MKALEKNFTKDGCTFTQLARTDKAYIYEMRKNNGNLHYDVFKHIENDSLDTVIYPDSTAIGVWLWSIANKERAIVIYQMLNQDMTKEEVIYFLCGGETTIVMNNEPDRINF